jgi:hypothetical protein
VPLSLQVYVLIGAALVVLMIVGLLMRASPPVFRRFLGSRNPLWVFVGVISAGALGLIFLASRYGLEIFVPQNLAAWPFLFGLAAVFGLMMILVDRRILFPADINVAFPTSLLFYPAIGLLAEMLFHILPLAVLLFLLNAVVKSANLSAMLWVCIPLVALIEPVFQVKDMPAANRYPGWGILVVGVLIYLINLAMLVIFQRYDFFSMYAFRLFYYLFWHILWGYMRLRLLFSANRAS